jgi:DNA invertase Pin-like site-specific DNA recombinase
MIPVAALYRLSTKKQVKRKAEHELDIPGQRSAVAQFLAGGPDWKLVEEYEEAGVSAFKKKAEQREVLQDCLRDAQDGRWSVLLVFKEDRLSRQGYPYLEMLARFEAFGVQVWSVADNKRLSLEDEQLIIRAAEAYTANQESKKTSVRVRSRMNDLARDGRWTGGKVPYGYQLVPRKDAAGNMVLRGGRIVQDLAPGEKSGIVREIFRRFCAGEGSFRITRWLNESREPSPAGGLWLTESVQWILNNPLYAGKIRYNTGKRAQTDEEILSDGQHLALIDWETYEAAQRVKSSRSSLPMRQRDSVYALNGILRCGLCGGPMGGQRRLQPLKDGSVSEYLVYRCNKHRQSAMCKMPTVRAAIVEEAFVAELDRRLGHPSELRTLIEEQAQAAAMQIRDYELARRRAKERIKEINLALKRVNRAYFEAAAMTDDDYRTVKAEYAAERAAIEEELSRPAPTVEAQDLSGLAEKVKEIRKNWAYLTAAERKALALNITKGYRLTAFVMPDKTVELRAE